MNEEYTLVKDILDMLLEALDGINEPRRLRVSLGALDAEIEVSNFEAAEMDDDIDQNEQ